MKTQSDVDRLCRNISRALSEIYSDRYCCDVKITAIPERARTNAEKNEHCGIPSFVGAD